MKVDAGLRITRLGEVGETARVLEEAGYDGVWVPEVNHDPFLPLLPAALATSRLSIGTSIAVAFARSPMTVAYMAHDLQEASEGRFILGLGSQVKAHVTRRFSMPWGQPVAQMREFILALRAIWACWDAGVPLDVQGTYYRHTLMTETFRPPASSYGAPPIFLAAVGTSMCRLAGEVADGLFVHPFSTERYLREVTLPALLEGADRAGRSHKDITVTCPGFVILDDRTEELAARTAAVRAQIAFYGSTPAYRPVLELHGWAELADRLHSLSITPDPSRWTAMAALIDDEMLHTFAVIGTPADAAGELLRRYADVVDRVTIPPAVGLRADGMREFMAGLHQ
jgi:probable F420-dependent oxidoreductase